MAPPHPTAKPSWGWLRVGGSKPPLKMPEQVTSRKKAIPGFMAYRRGCGGRPVTVLKGSVSFGQKRQRSRGVEPSSRPAGRSAFAQKPDSSRKHTTLGGLSGVSPQKEARRIWTWRGSSDGDCELEPNPGSVAAARPRQRRNKPAGQRDSTTRARRQ